MRAGTLTASSRERLREQHALGEEIATAITSAPIGEAVDVDELEDELANMEQEALDDKMLKTGTVPVADTVHRLPDAANGESTCPILGPVILGNASADQDLPAVKSKPQSSRQQQEELDEEAELARLQAEMAM